jgi:hypothetical protein
MRESNMYESMRNFFFHVPDVVHARWHHSLYRWYILSNTLRNPVANTIGGQPNLPERVLFSGVLV